MLLLACRFGKGRMTGSGAFLGGDNPNERGWVSMARKKTISELERDLEKAKAKAEMMKARLEYEKKKQKIKN